MTRVHNFNAGPAALPLPALERARDELCDFHGTGMSIMEHSHRGKAYEAVHHEAGALLRKLLGITDDYHVLFLQGGASQQFAMIPMNLLSAEQSADYVLTGVWSEKAIAEAKYYGKARIAATTAVDGRYTRVPAASEIELDPAAAYVHITSNNTIFGTQWSVFPDTGSVPAICDMSSDILSRRFDVSRFGIVYAGAQKNLGPSGLVVVIARKDLVARGRKDIPKVFRYATHADNDSLYNTPPTFGVYLLRNVLDWVEQQGGLEAIEATNRRKGELLYGALDRLAAFCRCPVERESRSLMNVVFRLPSEELEARFVSEATKAGLVGLKGHRSVGGIRASLYNAVSVEDVSSLVAFLEEFAAKNG